MKESTIWATMKKELLPSTITDLVRIESWNTEGVPDINGCHRGVEFWIECKSAEQNGSVKFQKMQIPWIIRRRRAGGRVFIAVACHDETLKLFDGSYVLDMEEHGINHVKPSISYPIEKYPKWDWRRIIEDIITVPLSKGGLA